MEKMDSYLKTTKNLNGDNFKLHSFIQRRFIKSLNKKLSNQYNLLNEKYNANVFE